MSKYTAPSIWTDEFNTPTANGLRGLLDADGKIVFDRARSKIEALGEIKEEMRWFGDCWFWTIAFIMEGTDEPLAILIPAAEEIQLASPLAEDFLNQLSSRRLKRFVRDGIELSMPPHKTSWAIWSTSTPPAVDDVMPVLKSKYKFYSPTE